MLDVVVNNARQLLLPNLQTVDADVVLDVFERASVAVDRRSELFETRNQLALLGFCVEDEAFVKRASDALYQLLANAILKQLLRIDLFVSTKH